MTTPQAARLCQLLDAPHTQRGCQHVTYRATSSPFRFEVVQGGCRSATDRWFADCLRRETQCLGASHLPPKLNAETRGEPADPVGCRRKSCPNAGPVRARRRPVRLWDGWGEPAATPGSDHVREAVPT